MWNLTPVLLYNLLDFMQHFGGCLVCKVGGLSTEKNDWSYLEAIQRQFQFKHILYKNISPIFTILTKLTALLQIYKYIKQKWSPDTSESCLFVQSSLVQLEQHTLCTNKHFLVNSEPPEPPRSSISAEPHSGNSHAPGWRLTRLTPKQNICICFVLYM